MSDIIRLFDCRLDAEAVKVIEPVLASGAIAAGSHIGDLENSLDLMHPNRHSVAVSNMTLALALALRLAGIGPGDDVLTLAFNCLSSNSAIVMVGARAVWVDLDPQTLTIDIEDCKKALTKNTKALLVYHVAGYPADISVLENFCYANGLTLIEDGNNALGAESAGHKVGTAGAYSILSFYPNRQVNAIDGAAILCANSMDAERARKLRRYGVDSEKFRNSDGEISDEAQVTEIGLPASMSNVSARLACHQLNLLELRLQKTRENALKLKDALNNNNIIPISWSSVDKPSFWAFAIRSNKRDKIMRFLKSKGIECSKLHQRNDVYSGFSSSIPRKLAGTNVIEQEMLAIPTGWWLSHEQLDCVIRHLIEANYS